MFVVKLDPDGQLRYGTYVGAAGNDQGLDIAQEGGRAFVTGDTDSTSFPTTTDAYSENFNGGTHDAFVFRLGQAGGCARLLDVPGWLGRRPWQWHRPRRRRSRGNGITLSANFPTLAGFDMTYGGNNDAFVTRLTSNGRNLVASTFLGGSV